jgi:hypothetical protein
MKYICLWWGWAVLRVKLVERLALIFVHTHIELVAGFTFTAKSKAHIF